MYCYNNWTVLASLGRVMFQCSSLYSVYICYFSVHIYTHGGMSQTKFFDLEDESKWLHVEVAKEAGCVLHIQDRSGLCSRAVNGVLYMKWKIYCLQ